MTFFSLFIVSRCILLGRVSELRALCSRRERAKATGGREDEVGVEKCWNSYRFPPPPVNSTSHTVTAIMVHTFSTAAGAGCAVEFGG